MKLRPHPLLHEFACGHSLLQVYIDPEFMVLAERAMENCSMPAEEYFASMLDQALRKEMVAQGFTKPGVIDWSKV
jgi:hypothetical protein